MWVRRDTSSGFVTFLCVILGNYVTSLQVCTSVKSPEDITYGFLWAEGKLTYIKVPGVGFAPGHISRGRNEKNTKSALTYPFYFILKELPHLSFDSFCPYAMCVERNRFTWLKNSHKSSVMSQWTTCYRVSPASFSCLPNAPRPLSGMVQVMEPRMLLRRAWPLLLTLRVCH